MLKLKKLKLPKSWDVYQGELHTQNGTSPRERCVLQSVKLEGKGHLMPLTLHIELYDLAFALVVLRLALAQYLLTIPPFLSVRK